MGTTVPFSVSFLRQLGFFPILICGYAVYYLFDVWGGRFETLGYGLLCIALVLGLTALLAARAIAGNGPGEAPAEYKSRGFVAIGLLTAYVVAQIYFGFVAATFVFSAVGLWWLGYHRPAHWAVATFGITGLSYLILVVILKVPVPMGPFAG